MLKDARLSLSRRTPVSLLLTTTYLTTPPPLPRTHKNAHTLQLHPLCSHQSRFTEWKDYLFSAVPASQAGRGRRCHCSARVQEHPEDVETNKEQIERRWCGAPHRHANVGHLASAFVCLNELTATIKLVCITSSAAYDPESGTLSH